MVIKKFLKIIVFSSLILTMAYVNAESVGIFTNKTSETTTEKAIKMSLSFERLSDCRQSQGHRP